MYEHLPAWITRPAAITAIPDVEATARQPPSEFRALLDARTTISPHKSMSPSSIPAKRPRPGALSNHPSRLEPPAVAPVTEPATRRAGRRPTLKPRPRDPNFVRVQKTSGTNDPDRKGPDRLRTPERPPSQNRRHNASRQGSTSVRHLHGPPRAASWPIGEFPIFVRRAQVPRRQRMKAKQAPKAHVPCPRFLPPEATRQVG